MAVYSLGDWAIGAAATQVPDNNDDEVVTELEGILALLCVVRFIYGSGGSSCRVYLQTSADQGVTWFDIACFLFTATNDQKRVNLSGLTPVTTPVQVSDASLTDNTAVDGALGDRFRVKIVSTGTYADSTLVSVRIHTR